MFDKIDKLQEKIAKLRPLNKTELEKLRENFIIENTYNSNAIEGNTLTLRETALILQQGITIQGKKVREHLEVVIAPKIGTNFGGLFIMKLTDENRIEMYRLKKEGYSYKELSKKFEIDPSNVKYMVKLADLHGETVLIKGKNNYYPPELKLDIINEVLILGHSIKSTSLKYALPNPALLSNWISKFKENGYNILEKPRGRTSKMKNNNKKIEKNELSKVEQLEKELEYLRAENAVLKKLREIRLKQSQTKKKQK